MTGHLTWAFMESIGTVWDSEEPSHMENIDTRAVNRFIHYDLIRGQK